MSNNPTISKDWLKNKYWIEHKTAKEMAELRKVTHTHIYDLIKKYDLSKRKNGIKFKGKLNYKMPEKEKAKHRVQKYSKSILVYKGKNTKVFKSFTSIAAAAKALGIRRENIRDCLNPLKSRNSSKKFKFELKKYKGEILIERRMNLDFTLEFDKVTVGLTANLPTYPYQERLEHYNKKLKNVFNNIKKV